MSFQSCLCCTCATPWHRLYYAVAAECDGLAHVLWACSTAVSVLYRHLWLDIGSQLPSSQQGEDEEDDDLQALTVAWCSKRLSNLDYLLHLNRLAGRRYGDRTFHPFLPWSAP